MKTIISKKGYTKAKTVKKALQSGKRKTIMTMASGASGGNS
jgi:hypothetical protein